MRGWNGQSSWVLILGVLFLGISLVWGNGQSVWADQEEQFTPEYEKHRTSFDKKHTPKLLAPDSVKRGKWFDVTIRVGADGPHPSLTEHHVRYIALYKDSVEITRVYLHPVFSYPKVTFTIALDKSGTLRAIEEPTHSATWEVSKKIKVTP